MKLLTKDIERKLKRNYEINDDGKGGETDHVPVVKFFYRSATWLITEMNDDGVMYGLCDLGWGQPEIGYVHFSELESIAGMERDAWFVGNKTLTEYAKQAREEGYIFA